MQTTGHSIGLFKPAYTGSMLGYVACRVYVGICFITAGFTPKISATPRANMLTRMARLGCIARINGHHRHTCEGSLVPDELFQFVEGPQVEAAALALALAGRLADARQVLQHNGLLVRLRLLYDVLADFVVNVLLKTPLFAAKRGKETAAVAPRGCARPLSGLRLKRPAHPVTLLTVGIQLVSSVVRAVRQCTNVVDAPIHPERVGRLVLFGKVGFDLNVNVVRSALLAENRARRLLPRKLFTLPISNVEIKSFTARQKRQADCPVALSKREDALVVVNRGRLKRAVPRLFRLEAWGNPAESADREVGAQPESLPHLMVAELLEFVLGALLVLPAYIGDVVTRIGKCLHRHFDVLLLMGGQSPACTIWS